MIDLLQQLQLDLAGLLNSAPANTRLATYRYVTVMVERPRRKADGTMEDATMIQQTVEQALAGLIAKDGKSGLAAIVMMPDAGIPTGMERLRGLFLQLEPIIRIIEDPMVNAGAEGVGITAEQLALETLSVVDGWKPGRMELPLRGRDKSALTPVRGILPATQVGWDIHLTTRLYVPPATAASAPVISTAGVLPEVTITLTSPDAGADIFYTLDGSFPSVEGNAAALPYGAPFPVATTCTVRAVAYLADCLPSHISEVDVGPT